MRLLFLFFALSGFASLVYEIVWLRLAMAAFGVTTALVSLVLSVFMAGLAIGSFAGGRLARRWRMRPPSFFLRLYAAAELLVGASVLLVPAGIDLGRALLNAAGTHVAFGSAGHHLLAGSLIALILVPFCVAMGATFPFAMAAVRASGAEGGARSFSYLYVANVIGATAGTLVSALLLSELLGFRGTLRATSILNVLVAAVAFALSSRAGAGDASTGEPTAEVAAAPKAARTRSTPALLFATGFVSMAMEVVWVRQYTPYLGTLVYAFATILALYLAANGLGSAIYRRWAGAGCWNGDRTPGPLAWTVVGIFGLLPLLGADPSLPLPPTMKAGVLRLALGAVPVCVAVGFLTPMLIDSRSGGEPKAAGRAYAINVVGCILGPLAAGFWLLPALGERGSLVALSVLLFAAALLREVDPRPEHGRSRHHVMPPPGGGRMARRIAVVAVALPLSATIVLLTRGYESGFPSSAVRRDHTATVIAAGEGMGKHLLVNGIGITELTPITKLMAHLPVASRPAPPRSSLTVCFGMGTTFRSALSWGAPATAVELVPSVPSLFGYFHADGPELLRSPLARVVIDDGRRFLERSTERFDVITIDPPPPVEAAGSSLLYSKEFYAIAKAHLSEDGILQQWFPSDDPVVLAAVARALEESFPHVRAFRSVEGWGWHFLASTRPLPRLSPSALAARLPPAAAADLVEWEPWRTPEMVFEALLSRELPVADLIRLAPDTEALVDDRPVNEYFLLRSRFGP